MFEESANFFGRERAREPLHVVLHEHLDGGAHNRATTLDRGVHAAADRHVRAEKNLFLCHSERSEESLIVSVSYLPLVGRKSQRCFAPLNMTVENERIR